MWLVYSAVMNGSFCKYCILFTPKVVGRSSLGVHVGKAFSGAQHYVNGRQYLCKHAKKEYHLTVVIKCEQLQGSLNNITIVNLYE